MARFRFRLLLPLLLVMANLAACLTFFFTRDPDAEHYARFRTMAATGDFTFSTADAQHFADRPFYGFGFHGRDSWWVRWLLVANAPALAVADASAGTLTEMLLARLPGVASICLDPHSWVRAFALVLLGSFQWAVVGFVVALGLNRWSRADGSETHPEPSLRAP